MRIIFLLLAIASLGSCTTPQKKNTNRNRIKDVNGEISKINTQDLAGTYAYGKDVEAEATGSIMIYPNDDTTVLFNIEISKGPPSYNSGQLYDTLTVKNNQALYIKASDGNGPGCTWQLDFLGDSILVKTMNDAYDCGFGGNVIADGTYHIVSRTAPEYFIGREGDTTYFNKK